MHMYRDPHSSPGTEFWESMHDGHLHQRPENWREVYQRHQWPTTTNCRECEADRCGIWKDITMKVESSDSNIQIWTDVPHLICPCFQCAAKKSFHWGSYTKNMDFPTSYLWNWEPIPCNGCIITNGEEKRELTNHETIMMMYNEYCKISAIPAEIPICVKTLHLMLFGHYSNICQIESVDDIFMLEQCEITPHNEHIIPRGDLLTYFNFMIQYWETISDNHIELQFRTIYTNEEKDDLNNLFESLFVDPEGINNTISEYNNTYERNIELENQEDHQFLEILNDVSNIFDDTEEYDEPPEGDENWLQNIIENNNNIPIENVNEIQIRNQNRIHNLLNEINFRPIEQEEGIDHYEEGEINHRLTPQIDIRQLCFQGIGIIDEIMDSERESIMSEENYRQIMNIFQEIYQNQ